MNNITLIPAQAYVSIQSRIALANRSDRGSVTAEYGTVILVAIALALAVFGIISGHLLDASIKTLLGGVLAKAAALNAKA